jgi:quercetin dioxygenase-like cupin family protein/ribosome-binding protein aMBF1 (putative translation factor)
MEEQSKETSYESFREAAEEYGEMRGDDLLTDAAAVSAVKEQAERENLVGHGQKVRESRERLGLTLEAVADKAGVDPALLADLEAGRAVLPLGQLIKISKALSLKMSDVISAGKDAFTIVRADQGRAFLRFGRAKRESHGYEYLSLAPTKKDRAMEPFLVTLHPAASDEPSSHDGQEFIYVLEGEMELRIEDVRDILRPGDAVYYDSTSMHLVRAHGDKPAKILAVLVS